MICAAFKASAQRIAGTAFSRRQLHLRAEPGKTGAGPALFPRRHLHSRIAPGCSGVRRREESHSDEYNRRQPLSLVGRAEDHLLLELRNNHVATGFEMLAVVLSHVSRTSCYRMIKLGNPAFTRLPRFLTPMEGKVHAFGTIQKTFSLLDTEIRHLSNPSTVDFLALAGDIEDHANNLPHIAQRVRKITDNLNTSWEWR